MSRCVREHADKGWHTFAPDSFSDDATNSSSSKAKVVEEQRNWQPRGRYPFPALVTHLVMGVRQCWVSMTDTAAAATSQLVLRLIKEGNKKGREEWEVGRTFPSSFPLL